VSFIDQYSKTPFYVYEKYFAYHQTVILFFALAIGFKYTNFNTTTWAQAIKKSTLTLVASFLLIVFLILTRAYLLNFGFATVYEKKWEKYIDLDGKLSFEYPGNLIYKNKENDRNGYSTFFYNSNETEFIYPIIRIAINISTTTPSKNSITPLFESCKFDIRNKLNGVENFESGQSADFSFERFLDFKKTDEGINSVTFTKGYFFIARKENTCYMINIPSPDAYLHKDDVEKIFSSVEIINI
jgi:hypothetical protein